MDSIKSCSFVVNISQSRLMPYLCDLVLIGTHLALGGLHRFMGHLLPCHECWIDPLAAWAVHLCVIWVDSWAWKSTMLPLFQKGVCCCCLEAKRKYTELISCKKPYSRLEFTPADIFVTVTTCIAVDVGYHTNKQYKSWESHGDTRANETWNVWKDNRCPFKSYSTKKSWTTKS